MIITISAAQGQGKTTILNNLEVSGYRIQKNTTARGIMAEWNKDLNEIYSNPPLAQQFQDEILSRQEQYDKEMIESGDLIITERSYADIFTYALFALGSINNYNEWLQEYYRKCCELQKNYKNVIFLTGRDYTPEDDGVRSINPQFGQSVDLIVEHFTNQMESRFDQIININTADLNGRLNIIKYHLESLKEK